MICPSGAENIKKAAKAALPASPPRLGRPVWQTDSEEAGCAQWCPTLWDPMRCSPPGPSVHGDSPGENTGMGCHFLLQDTGWRGLWFSTATTNSAHTIRQTLCINHLSKFSRKLFPVCKWGLWSSERLRPLVKVAQFIGVGAGFEPSNMRLQNWVCKHNLSLQFWKGGWGAERGGWTQSLPKGQMSVLSPETLAYNTLPTKSHVSPSGRNLGQWHDKQ